MGSLRDGHRGRTGWRCRYHHKGRLHIEGNTLALIGEDLLDAIYERAQKTFGPEGDLAYKPFRLYVRNMFLRGNWSGIAVGQTTNLMASLLFPSATVLASVPGTLPGPAVLVPEVDDPSAEPGCNYWTSPDSHRTRLAPNSDFYMLTARLAEYQRQVGPERSTKKRVTGAGSKEHTTYLKALVQYAVGGEDVVMKRLLQRRKAKEGLTMAALDEALVVPNLVRSCWLFDLFGSSADTLGDVVISSGARSWYYWLVPCVTWEKRSGRDFPLYAWFRSTLRVSCRTCRTPVRHPRQQSEDCQETAVRLFRSLFQSAFTAVRQG